MTSDGMAPVTGIIDVNSYHDSWILAEDDGVGIQGFDPALFETTETLSAPGDSALEVEIDLTATNIGDGQLPSTVIVGLLPVDVKDNLAATGVDSVSKTANEDDPGYQEDFWIMAPLQGPAHPNGPLPAGVAYENLSEVSIGMGDTDLGELISANATPDSDTEDDNNVSSVIDLDGEHHGVLWQGSGNGIDSEEVVKLKINGGADQFPLPVKVKAMKYRVVKVSVVPIKLPGSASHPHTLTEGAIKAELNKIFAYQLNAWFDVDIKDTVSFDCDPDGNKKITIESQEYENLLTAQKDPFSDITVLLLGRVELGTMFNNVFIKYNGHSDRNRNMAVVGTTYFHNGTQAFRLKDNDEVIHTMAHEIAHVFIDEFHPDDDGGDAPLAGTDRTKRILCSGANSTLNSNLLVKTEWDKAEMWLKARPLGDN